MALLRAGNRLIPLILIIFIVGIFVSRFNDRGYQDQYIKAYEPDQPAPVPPPIDDDRPVDIGGLNQPQEQEQKQEEPLLPKDPPKKQEQLPPVDAAPKKEAPKEPAAPLQPSKEPSKTLNEHGASPAQAVSVSPSLMKHGGGRAPAPRDGVLLAVNGWKDPEQTPIVDEKVYNRISSQSTKDKKYFDVKMGRYKSYNPNILPHPSLKDQYVLVCQHEKYGSKDPVFAQMACNAAFREDGVLDCVEPPMWVPYAGTNPVLATKTITVNGVATTTEESSKCTDNLQFLRFNVGPHDARVFWGPDRPFSTFGSNSDIICFSQWIQDFRQLFLGETWKGELAGTKAPINIFGNETELQRPPPFGDVEKNWFLFWDDKDQAYIHHDSTPRRVFAKLNADGTVGENLAPAVAEHDNPCLEKLMPEVAETLESIHQATNSLAVTMCKRSDPTCKATADNTFIMQIFHWKSYFFMHGAYEPYVMLFHQRAPFELYGISERALWIEGRRVMNMKTCGNIWKDFDPWSLPKNHTEMIYVTSITWKDPGLKYHGYLDDVMFLGFGIEDKHAGAIDVLAGDVLKDMGLCKESSTSSGSSHASSGSEGSSGSPGLAGSGVVGAGAAAPPPGSGGP